MMTKCLLGILEVNVKGKNTYQSKWRFVEFHRRKSSNC